MKKSAVVLVVKNELSLVKHWINWYKYLEFDSIIIFDDSSTDGTKEFLLSMNNADEIILEETVGSLSDWYYERQQRCYKYIIKKYRYKYEWLAFLDVDEFLYLNKDTKINDFLERFANADGIAVNWCAYGSSGHVLRPSVSPVVAYTWHALPSRAVNRHVKSIVRPNKLGTNWYNVHAFDVDKTKYFLPNGDLVTWSDTIGIISHDPDWSVAKIMHYQCRSMEDFVERAKKRPEIDISSDTWQQTDYHDVQDTDPSDRLALLNKINRSDKMFTAPITRKSENKERSCGYLYNPQKSEKNRLSLDDVGRIVGTDKSSLHHGYLNFYEYFFHYLKDSVVTLLEIGTDSNKSLYMWENYFHNGHIVGAMQKKTADTYKSDRLDIEIGHQNDRRFLEKLAKNFGNFDIIIDDGTHKWEDQKRTFEILFDHVKPNGFYIVEDLQTSFKRHDSFEYFKGSSDRSTVEYMYDVASVVLSRDRQFCADPFFAKFINDIEFLAFHFGVCIIRKL